MSELPGLPPSTEQSANSLRGGLGLLGVVLLANLLDLACRCADLGAPATAYQTFLLVVQAGVCGALSLLIGFAICCLRARAKPQPAPLALPRRGLPRAPVPAGRN